MSRSRRRVVLVFVGLASAFAGGCREAQRNDSVQVAKAVAPPASPAAAPIPVPGWPDSTFVPTPGWGLPHGGAWTPTQLYRGDGWTIEYPVSAQAELRTAGHGEPSRLIISELPECSYPCIVTVSVHMDSTAAMSDTAPTKTPGGERTGVSSDAADDDDELRVLDTLDLGASRGILYESYCGDCAAHLLLVRRSDRVAAIGYNADDRNPYSPALLGRLDGVLRSFRWTEGRQ